MVTPLSCLTLPAYVIGSTESCEYVRLSRHGACSQQHTCILVYELLLQHRRRNHLLKDLCTSRESSQKLADTDQPGAVEYASNKIRGASRQVSNTSHLQNHAAKDAAGREVKEHVWIRIARTKLHSSNSVFCALLVPLHPRLRCSTMQ
jgi:hypothetical protein